MQSRILLSSAGAATYNVTRKSSSWVALPDIQLLRGLASISAGRTADPAVHSGNYDAEPVANTEDPLPNQVEVINIYLDLHIDHIYIYSYLMN